MVLYTVYNPPKHRPYRYHLDGYEKITDVLMKHNQKPIIVSKFPLADWSLHESPTEDENNAIDVLEKLNLTQRNKKPMLGSKILDVIFSKMFLEPELATDFAKVISISDYRALSFEPELGCDNLKPVYDIQHSFGASALQTMSNQVIYWMRTHLKQSVLLISIKCTWNLHPISTK